MGRRSIVARRAVSKLDPLRGWIEEQLRADPRIPSKRLRELAEELGYEGGKTIFDDFVREVRPRFLRPRTFQRTVYRPGELCQFDLWEPREPVAGRPWPGPSRLGGHRRAVLVAGVGRRAGVLEGVAGHRLGHDAAASAGFGALPEKLVWDREGAIHAGGGRPSAEFAAFCGRLGVGWVILEAGDAEAKGLLERSHRFMRSNFEPGRRFANELDFQAQLDGWTEKANDRVHRTIARRAGEAAGQRARADAAAAASARHRPSVRDPGAPAALSAL